MSYCDIADVQAQLPARRFTPTSAPSIEDVQRYITNRSAELDAMLAEKGITVPVVDTATIARGWLKLACAYGAGADAEAAGPNTTAGTEGEHLTYLRGRWDAMTRMLIDGQVSLQDAPRDPATGTGVSVFHGGSGIGTAWFTRSDLDGGRLDGWPPNAAGI